MKNDFLSRFDNYQIRKTAILLLLSISLIVISLLVGLTDNLPMILIFLGGMILFFFAALNLWQNVTYYAILIASCAAIFTINWILKASLGEDIAMSVGFICAAGFIAGIIGLFTFASKWNRLSYTGASLSLLAAAILIINMPPPSDMKNTTLVTEWILIGLQLFISILFLIIGYLNQPERRLINLSLITLAIILILMSFWGFLMSYLEFFTPTISSLQLTFWKSSIRIYAVVDIIIAFLAFYAYLKIPKTSDV